MEYNYHFYFYFSHAHTMPIVSQARISSAYKALFFGRRFKALKAFYACHDFLSPTPSRT